MNYTTRVRSFQSGEDVQIRLMDGTTMLAQYVGSSDYFIFVANEEGQFSLPAANMLWMRKDLLEEER